MLTSKYYLGCPVWACEKWKGELFTRAATRDQWLEQYAHAFNAVEGNSTFYAIPTLKTVRRWAAVVQPGFRFALKFPRTVSHGKRLLHAETDTRTFLQVLDVLHEAGQLGLAFLQLPHSFSGTHLDDLETYLRSLPQDFTYAVELRHEDFFDQAETERRLDDVLGELKINRVIFDSRALFAFPPSDAAEQASQARKPKLPVHPTVTGQHPMLRFIGRDEVSRVHPWIKEWAPRVGRWIEAGLQPLVFTHTPDEFFAPRFARAFHDELVRHCHALKELPPWPGERERFAKRQLELF